MRIAALFCKAEWGRIIRAHDYEVNADQHAEHTKKNGFCEGGTNQNANKQINKQTIKETKKQPNQTNIYIYIYINKYM
jgi:hypothetical protein